MKPSITFIISLCLIIASCSCSKKTDSATTDLTGTLQKQGITTYMYGTHILMTNAGPAYALRSDDINLDNYINKVIDIQGTKVPGYPVDGGPDYINVTSVKALSQRK